VRIETSALQKSGWAKGIVRWIKDNTLYQPLESLVKDGYVAPGWTDTELKRMVRYYSWLVYLGHIPYDEFTNGHRPLKRKGHEVVTGRTTADAGKADLGRPMDIRLPNMKGESAMPKKAMTEGDLLKMGLMIDPNDPSKAVRVDATPAELPDDDWDEGRLVEFVRKGLGQSDQLNKTATQLARQSTVQLYRAGQALCILRGRLKPGQKWVDGPGKDRRGPGGIAESRGREETGVRN
jgi:hypothetical protein